MRAIMKYDAPLVPPPADYAGDFFQDVAAALVGVGLIVNSESAPGVLSLDKVPTHYAHARTHTHTDTRTDTRTHADVHVRTYAQTLRSNLFEIK